MKTVATLYLLLVSVPLTCATNPAVDDSKVSTETHFPGSVVSFSLLCPFLYLHGFLVACYMHNLGSKVCLLSTIFLAIYLVMPCIWSLGMTYDSISGAISTILFAICPPFVQPVILPFHVLFHQRWMVSLSRFLLSLILPEWHRSLNILPLDCSTWEFEATANLLLFWYEGMVRMKPQLLLYPDQFVL